MAVFEQYMHVPAWTEGYTDHIEGAMREHNPYQKEKGSIPYQAWDQGWCAAEKERKHVEVIDPLETATPYSEATP